MTKTKVIKNIPKIFDEALPLAGDPEVFKALVNAHVNFIIGVLIEHGLTSEDEFLEGVKWHYSHIANELEEKEIQWN